MPGDPPGRGSAPGQCRPPLLRLAHLAPEAHGAPSLLALADALADFCADLYLAGKRPVDIWPPKVHDAPHGEDGQAHERSEDPAGDGPAHGS